MAVKPDPSNNQIWQKFSAGSVNTAIKNAVKEAIKESGNQLDTGFQNESTPGGGKWKQLSPSYAKWKAATVGNKPILELHGTLKAGAKNSVKTAKPALQSAGVATATVTYSGPSYAKAVNDVRPFWEFQGQAATDIEQVGLKAFEKGFV
jgi:hypothetical protein